MRGDEIGFPDGIDTAGWTDFRARIWNATRLIPYGQTRSYSWVAATAGQPRASRAAGQALHYNPVPILVPCHRVVGANGELVGFGGGLALKQQLLLLERDHAEASLDAVHPIAEKAG
jgi:methylated-DNA-[protein]-cysteine S-methyltransferase